MSFLLIFLYRNSSLTKTTSSSFFRQVAMYLCNSFVVVIFQLLIAVRISFKPSMPAHGQQGKGNVLCWEKFLQRNFTNVTNHTNFFLLHSFTCFPKVFVPNLPKQSKPSASKLQHPWALKKFEPCQLYTFCQEFSFQYVRVQGTVPKKFICASKITGHHFPGWVKKLKLRTRVHKHTFSSACEKYLLLKTKI